jgi:hypothetical protein
MNQDVGQSAEIHVELRSAVHPLQSINSKINRDDYKSVIIPLRDPTCSRTHHTLIKLDKSGLPMIINYENALNHV